MTTTVNKFRTLMLVAMAFAGGLRADPANTNAPGASLLLIGVTNSTAGVFATFVLSNGSPAHIVCVPEAMERETNGVWVKTSLMGKGQRLVRNWNRVPEELSANEAASFRVPAPTTNGSWRIAFTCQEQRVIVDRAADIYRHVTSSNAAATNLRQFSGRRYSVVSPEVRATR